MSHSDAKAGAEAQAISQPEQDKTFWESQWTSHHVAGPEAETWLNDLHGVLLDFVRPYLPPPGGTIAEIGCGSGQLLATIGRERPDLKLIGIDYESSALSQVAETARVYGVNIETKLDDVNSMSVPDQTFDMVTSGGLLEHLPDPMPALREMVRTLKPGGTFYAGVVPRKWFSLHRPLHRWLGPSVYRTSYNGALFAKWLREAGLTDVVHVSSGAYPPLFHHLPTAPRRLILNLFRRLDGTRFADLFGYSFLLAGRKPAARV